jgi:hypothetical protein
MQRLHYHHLHQSRLKVTHPFSFVSLFQGISMTYFGILWWYVLSKQKESTQFFKE